MNFENTTTFDLMQMAVAFRTQLQKAMNEIGLHSGQIFVLISLWKNDGQSQINLVKGLNLSSPTINKMIKSLIKGGFVECRKCAADNRMMRVYLTEKGQQAENLAAEKWGELEIRLYSNLTETEKLIFSQLFVKLKESLNNRIQV